MIDPKVFAELMNRGTITQVGLNPSNYKDIDDLQRHGLATIVDADEAYDDIVNELIDKKAVLEKFLADLTAGGTVVVPMDFVFTEPIIIEKDVTIDLNGHTLTNTPWDEDGEANAYVFWVKSGKLTLVGDGEVVAHDAIYSMAVWANGGDVEINGGTYKNGGDSCDLVYASKKGNVIINGGSFIPAGPASGTVPGTKNPYCALNVKDANRSTCTISVKGGRFYKFDPANNVSEGDNTNFVVEGYESVAQGDWYIVREAADIVVDDNVE